MGEVEGVGVLTAVDVGKAVIFDGRRTAGAWGAFLRSLVLLPERGAGGTARRKQGAVASASRARRTA